MRPRQLLTLGLLAAVPVIVGLVLLSNGGTARHPEGARTAPAAAAGSGVPVTLHLGGARGKVLIRACGTSHHYSLYRAGAAIAVDVATTTRGRWSARLKYKLCRSGSFQTAGEAALGHLGTAALHATVRAPAPGLYAARVELHTGGALAGRSRKRYFEVR